MNAPFRMRVETIARQEEPLRRVLGQYAGISLAEMNAVQLLDRTETKYVLREDQALAALAQLGRHYRVLEVDGKRANPYQTLYFDTADWQLFEQHHAGAAVRYKVRAT